MLTRYVFFFSSRRRHTRFDCDWSSDVCSSDLSGASPTSHGASAAQSFRCATFLSARASHLPRALWPEESRGERSEEHTSELQSQSNLVCRLLLDKTNLVGGVEPLLDRLHRRLE